MHHPGQQVMDSQQAHRLGSITSELHSSLGDSTSIPVGLWFCDTRAAHRLGEHGASERNAVKTARERNKEEMAELGLHKPFVPVTWGVSVPGGNSW